MEQNFVSTRIPTEDRPGLSHMIFDRPQKILMANTDYVGVDEQVI